MRRTERRPGDPADPLLPGRRASAPIAGQDERAAELMNLDYDFSRIEPSDVLFTIMRREFDCRARLSRRTPDSIGYRWLDTRFDRVDNGKRPGTTWIFPGCAAPAVPSETASPIDCSVLTRLDGLGGGHEAPLPFLAVCSHLQKPRSGESRALRERFPGGAG
jgi:hypothetical protein